jgi:polar amino acid transport system substrate-binding protein
MVSRRAFVSGVGAAGLASVLPLAAMAQTTESAMARILRTKTLRTGFVAGAAPYFTKSVATGEWQGFCVDFAGQLATALGVKLQSVETTWGNAVLDLQSNKIDCMFAMAPTPQREKMVGFTNPLFQNTFTLVARKGFDPKTWADVDKAGVRIGVDIGSNQDTFATQTLKTATIQRFETSGDATLAVQTGRVDAQLLVVLLGETVLAKSPTLGHLIVPTPLGSAPTSIGIQKESDPALANAINAWLVKERASGNIKQTIVSNMQKLANVPAGAFPKEVTF